MEADWSAEVGPDLAEMVVPWEGFVDLRQDFAETQEILEAAQLPALAAALRALNSGSSPFFTSKCDIWRLSAEEIDGDEFGAEQGSAMSGFACYIDVLDRRPESFASFEFHEALAKEITRELQGLAMADCRVDLVIRAASVEGIEGYGVTLYAAACGVDEGAAQASWESVLGAAVLVTIDVGLAASAGLT